MADGLKITPEKELAFRFELKKTIPTTIKITNSGKEETAFKVKTTAPKKYCVKPNTGFVRPGETQMIQVIMQAQREWPADISGCKDKFLVQTTPSKGNADFAELFAKGKADITESKLRVVYSQPAPPPSPVPEGDEGVNYGPSSMDAGVAHRGPMSDDVSVLQRDLERYRINNESLTMDLKMAIQNNNRGAAAAKGFTLMHLLLVAIVAFFIGHYT